jgi:DNA-binding GntR family transcriptional regulator
MTEERATREQQKPPSAIPGRSIAEKAYRELRLSVVECRVAPGQHLTEAAVARQLGVGKTPAREALRRLVLEGLARVRPRHGYIVAPITLRDVQELFDLRLLVEPAAAAMATGNLQTVSTTNLKRLSLVGYDRGGPGAVRKFVRSNTEFHEQIARLSGNHRVEHLVVQLLSESERLINFGALSHPQSARTVDEHVRLVEAIEAGNAPLARRIAEEHIRATREMVIESLLSDARLRDLSITHRRLRITPKKLDDFVL